MGILIWESSPYPQKGFTPSSKGSGLGFKVPAMISCRIKLSVPCTMRSSTKESRKGLDFKQGVGNQPWQGIQADSGFQSRGCPEFRRTFESECSGGTDSQEDFCSPWVSASAVLLPQSSKSGSNDTCLCYIMTGWEECVVCHSLVAAT